MGLNYLIQRNWLNLKRHKVVIYVSIPVFTFMMILIGSIYTKSLVEAILKVPTFQAVVNNRNIPDAGMLVWFLIYTSIFIMIFPAVGIFLGIRMLPFNERDGKELIFSTKMSIFKYFLENFILAMILVPATASPIFFVSVLFLGITSDTIISMAIAVILPVFFVMVVTMVSVFGASIKNSSRIGYGFGGIFYITCFILNLLANEIQTSPVSFINNFSPLYQMDVFDNALNQTWNLNYILTSVIIIFILFILTLVFLYRTDYIESRSSSVGHIEVGTGTKRKFTSRFSFIRTPVESILKKVGWKNPAFRDQLQSSAGFFIVYTIVTTMLVMVVVLAYPGNENMKLLFTDMNSLIGNPMIAAFMFGHTVTAANNANLEGFLLFKLLTFHWLYYGPYLFIGTYYVVMRDKNDKYDEITWSLPRTRGSILVARTGAMILYFWISIFINWIGLWLAVPILQTYLVATPPDVLATISTFVFLALGYSLFLILFIAIAVIVKSRYIIITLVGIFMISIFIPIISYVTENSVIDYLSPFRYFDVFGLLTRQVNIVTNAIPTILVGGILVIALYIVSIKVVTPKKDIA